MGLPSVIDVNGVQIMDGTGQTLHSQIAQANNVLWCAEGVGVSVFATQAPEFAEDHSGDTVIVVLRGGEAVAKGREALVAVADLVRDTL